MSCCRGMWIIQSIIHETAVKILKNDVSLVFDDHMSFCGNFETSTGISLKVRYLSTFWVHTCNRFKHSCHNNCLVHKKLPIQVLLRPFYNLLKYGKRTTTMDTVRVSLQIQSFFTSIL